MIEENKKKLYKLYDELRSRELVEDDYWGGARGFVNWLLGREPFLLHVAYLSAIKINRLNKKLPITKSNYLSLSVKNQKGEEA